MFIDGPPVPRWMIVVFLADLALMLLGVFVQGLGLAQVGRIMFFISAVPVFVGGGLGGLAMVALMAFTIACVVAYAGMMTHDGVVTAWRWMTRQERTLEDAWMSVHYR
jgi:hypothetical protein